MYHWPGCWKAEGHHGCAIALIEEMARVSVSVVNGAVVDVDYSGELAEIEAAVLQSWPERVPT